MVTQVGRTVGLIANIRGHVVLVCQTFQIIFRMMHHHLIQSATYYIRRVRKYHAGYRK